MTRFTFFDCFVLLMFWMAGLSAFLIGGLVWAGYVFQLFLVVVFAWVGRELYREYWTSLLAMHYRNQVYDEWRENTRRKGDSGIA
jgi:hypothetical protein